MISRTRTLSVWEREGYHGISLTSFVFRYFNFELRLHCTFQFPHLRPEIEISICGGPFVKPIGCPHIGVNPLNNPTQKKKQLEIPKLKTLEISVEIKLGTFTFGRISALKLAGLWWRGSSSENMSFEKMGIGCRKTDQMPRSLGTRRTHYRRLNSKP